MKHTACAMLLLLMMACNAVAQQQSPPAGPPLEAGVAKTPFTFVAYGDIRFTEPNTARKQAASDPARRKLIVEKIADEKPAFVVVSGDLVLAGDDASDWAVWDRETQPLRDAGIKVFPSLGNHDLRGGDAGLANYFQRFPALANRRYYSLRAQNCLFFMLDGSYNEAPSEQLTWLGNELAHIPDDVQFVFFVLHYPLMTQSRDDMPAGDGIGRGGHSLRPQEAKLAEMLEAARAKAKQPFIVLAGHVHNYERYERNGVMYITTGGGGATPYRIERTPGDLYTQPGPTYHYCVLKVSDEKLEFQMNKVDLADTKPVWTEGDKFELKAPPKPKAAPTSKPRQQAPKVAPKKGKAKAAVK